MKEILAGTPMTPPPDNYSSIPTEPIVAEVKQEHFGLTEDRLAIATLFIVAIAFFWRTVFLGSCISKLGQIANLDYFWNLNMKPFSDYSPYDSSVLIFCEPLTRLARELLFAGQSPLWNPYDGCGVPLHCDPEVRLYSLLTLLFPPTVYFHCLSLVARCLLAEIGAFLLARKLGLGIIASIFTATSYAFCPIVLWQMELSFETFTYPWILLAFVVCTIKFEARRVALLAMSCAYVVCTMHPECSLNSITLASLFSCVLHGNNPRNLKFSVATIATAGALAILLASPILIPFTEYFVNSACTKEELTKMFTILWSSLSVSTFYPLVGATSPFIGCISMIALPWAIATRSRTTLSLFFLACITFLLVSLPGPLADLFLLKPLCNLEPIYCSPIFMLSIALLTAFGLERICKDKKTLWLSLASLVSISITIVLLRNIDLDAGGWNWDGAMQKAHIDLSIVTRNFGLCLAFLALSWSLSLRKKNYPKLLLVAALAINFTSQALVARTTLPAQPPFAFEQTPATKYLRDSGERMVAVGHIFFSSDLPGTYKIRELVFFNKVRPTGLDQFVNGCQSKFAKKRYEFYDSVSALVDLASVKNLVSRSPVLLETELLEHQTKLSPKVQATFEDGIALTSTDVVLDTKNRQITGLTKWKVTKEQRKALSMQCALLSSEGKEIWSGQAYPFALHQSQDEDYLLVPFLASIPNNFKDKQVRAVVRLVNVYTTAWCWPKNPMQFEFRPQITLDAFDLYKNADPGPTHFVLDKEFDDGVRVYRNTKAMPQAYFVPSAQIASDLNSALKALQSPLFNGSSTVVLTRTKDSIGPNLESERQNQLTPSTVETTRPSPCRVNLNVTARADGYVVLTDTFFPGWIALVDGVPTKIERANVLFRAVKVSKGNHKIVYRYQPFSQKIGIALGLLGLLIVIFMQLRGQRKD